METNENCQHAEDAQIEVLSDALAQLRRLAMLYHSRGLFKEAREIYQNWARMDSARRQPQLDE